MTLIRLTLLVAAVLLANAVAAGGSGAAATDRAAGEAYALGIGSPLRPVTNCPAVVLPPGGGTVVRSSAGGDVAPVSGITSIDQLAAMVEGGLTDGGGSVRSTATVGLVELFDGLVRATNVRVVAASAEQGGRFSSSGSATFGSLLVAGVSYPSPRPNERVELPGVGYAVLNEQLGSGDGPTSSTIVRAIRLVVTEPNVQGAPPGSELVVASVASGVPDIRATAAVASAADPVAGAAPIPSIALSTRAPIDTTIDQSGGVDNVELEDFNDNDSDDDDDDNDNGGSTTATTPSSDGARPAVVTVVVVIATPGSTPAAGPAPAPTGAATAVRAATPTPGR